MKTSPTNRVTRRNFLTRSVQFFALTGLSETVLISTAYAASDFWNKKAPTAWTNEEIAQLTSHSPWAREVNAEFGAPE